MAVMDLDEQEQIAELKAWWKRYGNLVTVIVLAISVGVLGYQGWNYYKSSQAQKAVVPYELLKQAIATGDVSKITGASDSLAKDFSMTTYATMGNLEAAQALFELKDLPGAAKRYQWVVDHGVETEWKMLARLNLAQVLIDQKQYDQALKALSVEPMPGFEAVLLSAKGDVHWAANNLPEARKAYQAAMTQLDKMPATISKEAVEEQQSALRQLLEFKLAAVGVEHE